MTATTTPRRYTLDGIDDGVIGYTLPDLERLRWNQQRQFPRPPKPRVRFWATDAQQNGLRMIEGTLDLDTIDVQHYGDDLVEYTITGYLLPPVTQYLVPDEIEHEMLPVEPLQDGLITTEADLDEGFETLGTIDPHNLNIETEIDYEVRDGRGRTIKTRETTTVEFSSCSLNPAVIARFFQR